MQTKVSALSTIGAVVLGISLSVTATGCRRRPKGPAQVQHVYVLAKSRLVVSEERTSAAEITPTKTYQQVLPTVQRVAVHAPDACNDVSVSGATGAANNTGQILQMRCGVWMAEIERALSQRGYQVPSWKELHNLVKTQNITPVAAADKLHAQVLVQLNSLERITRKPAQDARIERDYVLSDVYGKEHEPAQLLPNDVASLRALLAPAESALLQSERLGAMLDANAVLVSSGQAIWFYRWLKVAPFSAEQQAKVLAFFGPPASFKPAKGDPQTYLLGQPGTWTPVAPEPSPDAGPVTVTAVSSEREAISTGAKNASEDDATYFALVREVVADFVGKFSGK
ncbi:MAG: hypothetical protein U0359_02070 [Byssovorax sp.]